ncbi:MAG: SAM-dependent methyltransferase [Fluviicola sp.]|jgi:ubiquinone/menaquinone biosynthesis C-methylase UbiE|uniref:class I SAM-dependent methyltransferase n=1 Tax=Fluviicola sp. TaxID=1917219 RepID=UPI00262A2F1B|nr:class I SAM-dependent methyltransferase [Fluviicola sp.]MDF3026756.1 SAM-dependent methyltransferase [Fluviicola sp.]
MNDFDRKKHWETIYSTKELSEVSWYQPIPETSLNFLEEAQLEKNAKIIDIGGGDSFFADHLLAAGYTDITVVDISENALDRAKKRLGEKAALVKWIVGDATQLELEEHYDFWHDRAVFHFLTQVRDIANYRSVLDSYIKKGGVLVLGTFSENGPSKCSGIEIKQYSESSLTEAVSASFEKIKCITVDHQTPFDTTQNFVFCSFKKI